MCLINFTKNGQASKRFGDRKIDWRVPPKVEPLFLRAELIHLDGLYRWHIVGMELAYMEIFNLWPLPGTGYPFPVNFAQRNGQFSWNDTDFWTFFSNERGYDEIPTARVMELILDGAWSFKHVLQRLEPRLDVKNWNWVKEWN